jgi:HEAT repeat protein
MSDDTDESSSGRQRLLKILVVCFAVVLICFMAYHMSPDVRAWVVQKLGGRGAAAVPSLLKHMQDPDRIVSQAAEKTLCAMRSEAVPPLAEALRADDARTRADAARVLGLIGATAKDAVPALIAALQDADAVVREVSLEALGRIGTEARSALPAVRKLLEDTNGKVRAQACETVSLLAGPTADTMELMIHFLKTDPDGDVRAEAAEALGRFGRDGVTSEAMLNALKEALDDPHRHVANEAQEALLRINPQKASNRGTNSRPDSR